MTTSQVSAEDFLRERGAGIGARADWQVRSGPEAVEVSAWTSDRFTRPEQATVLLARILHELELLGLVVAGRCELAAHRDADGDWRGHLQVSLQPEAELLRAG